MASALRALPMHRRLYGSMAGFVAPPSRPFSSLSLSGRSLSPLQSGGPSGVGGSNGGGNGGGNGGRRRHDDAPPRAQVLVNALLWFVGGYAAVSIMFVRRNPVSGRFEFHMGSSGLIDRAFNNADATLHASIRELSVGHVSHPVLQRVGDRLLRAVPHISSDVPRIDFFLVDGNLVSALQPGGSPGPAAHAPPIAVTVGEASIALNRTIIGRLGSREVLVASIMAHELAHAVLKHSRQLSHYAAFLSMPVSLLRAAHVLLEGHGILEWAQVMGAPRDTSVADLLLARRSWSNEHEADIVGMMILARAGYHPKFAAVALSAIASGTRGFTQTHPPTPHRLAALERHMPEALALYHEGHPDGDGEDAG
jgi:Zn-dependent protease with chaperone function